MRNFWYLSFLAVMYIFLSWAAEAFAAEPSHTAASPLMQVLRREKRESAVEDSDAALESFSLSYTGNYILAETIKQGRELGSALMSALGGLMNLRTVRSIVDGMVNQLSEPRKGRSDLGRSSLEVEEEDDQEYLKEGITTLVGAALGEQQCWERSACLAGEYAADIPGRDVIFIVLDRIVPTSWARTIDTIKQSATYIENCEKYICSTETTDN